MKLTQLFPVLTAALIVVFYLFLPALHRCQLPVRLTDEAPKKRRDRWFVLALTLLYAAVSPGGAETSRFPLGRINVG